MRFPLSAALALALCITAEPAAALAGQQPLGAVNDLLRATQAVTVFDHVTASGAGAVITLDGKVTSKAKREQLETEVATVPGVRQVVNRIGVLSASPADEGLRQRVARAIYGHASFKPYAAMTHPPIRVLVERGRVTLAGEVRTPIERLVATSLAQDAAGRRVGDELRVAGG